jgi:hypothetical protein
LAPWTTQSREHPSSAPLTIVREATHDGSISVARKRDSIYAVAAALTGGPNRARTNKLGLLIPHPTGLCGHPSGTEAVYYQ